MKLAIYFGAFLGGLIGGYVPVLFWHTGVLSMSSILWGSVGTIIGLVIAIKIVRYLRY